LTAWVTVQALVQKSFVQTSFAQKSFAQESFVQKASVQKAPDLKLLYFAAPPLPLALAVA